MLRHSRKKNIALGLAAGLLLFFSTVRISFAQSSDSGYPAPVFSKELEGRIAPRDLGDPRRTRHFYTFRATEGDVLVTLEGAELVGDLDVFTATTQRPILKITLLGDAARITKSFYVRKDDTFVLRVEARAAGDVEGTYRITFGGSFAPAPTDFASAPQPTASPAPGAEPRGKGTRRVTSTGARIEEPAPIAPPVETASEVESKPAESAATNKPTKSKTTPAPRRGARNSSSRTRAGADKPKPATDASNPEAVAKPVAGVDSSTETKSGSEIKSDAGTPATANAKKPATRNRGARNSKRATRNESAATGETTSTRPATEPTPAPPAAPSQRLVIVTKDGETLERDMRTVRRVTVENNQLVVVLKDGKVSRQPMANVLRMSIEP